MLHGVGAEWLLLESLLGPSLSSRNVLGSHPLLRKQQGCFPGPQGASGFKTVKVMETTEDRGIWKTREDSGQVMVNCTWDRTLEHAGPVMGKPAPSRAWHLTNNRVDLCPVS